MRVGFVHITKELYENDYNIIHKMFEVFMPLAIQPRPYGHEDFLFYGRSDLFELKKQNQDVPHYVFNFVKNHDGEVTITAKKA